VAPPQYRGIWVKALQKLDGSPVLAPHGLVVAQIHPKEYQSLNLEALDRVRESSYGDTVLEFYVRKAADAVEG